VKTLIVIPTYNERENIEPLVEDILCVAPTVDILIVDDASPDGTGAVADTLSERLPQVSVLHRPGKLGLGTAYVRGFEHALAHGYELVFEMDADFSHDPRYLPEFLATAEDADLVIGSRYIPGGDTPNWSPLRRFISGGGNIFARALLRIPVHDCTSGFRCYRTTALSALNLSEVHSQGYAFQVELAYAVWRSGFTVAEVPIVFVDRRVGKSKMSRTIFIEAFRWVVTTRLFGSSVVRPTAPATPEQAEAAALADTPQTLGGIFAAGTPTDDQPARETATSL
jgi:dolichol-phosphate mannosyltransferase